MKRESNVLTQPVTEYQVLIHDYYRRVHGRHWLAVQVGIKRGMVVKDDKYEEAVSTLRHWVMGGTL